MERQRSARAGIAASALAFCAALGLCLLASPAANGQEAKPQRGGTLVMVVQPELTTLAGYMSTAGAIAQITTKIYDGLLEYDNSLKPIPGLAKSWSISSDGKTITFNLRKNVTFHDGFPFTSEDVKFSILDVLKKVHPRGINTFRVVQSIDTPDPYTAVFHLSEPAPYMMMALSGYESPMLPKHIFGKGDIRNHPNANMPIGTGPFKFVEWRKGEAIRLDRNPHYWKPGLPYLDHIVGRFIPDGATRAAALETQEAQLAGFNAVLPVDVRRLERLPYLAASTQGYEMSSPIVLLEMNTKRKPFDDVRVRQAVAYAIDRKFVVDNIWFGFGKPATGPISSNFRANGLYTADVKRYQVPDGVEIANKLLDQAGHPRDASGVRFGIDYEITPSGEEWRNLGEYVKQRLARVGIKVNLRSEDMSGWLRRLYTNYDFDMTSNWPQTLADPVIGVHRLYHSAAIKPGTMFMNDTRWSSPETDRLMDEAVTELDPDKRAELYHEFQRKVVEASPVVFVSELQFITVYNKRVHGAFISPLGLYSSYDHVWLSK